MTVPDGSTNVIDSMVLYVLNCVPQAMPEELLAITPPIVAAPSDAGSYAWLPSPVDFDDLRGEVRAALDVCVQWLRGHFPGLEITGELADGSPIDALVERSARNQLVVTGTRGRGGFAGMPLGSTSQGVLHNCTGPAMIVPRFEDPRLADRPDVAI